MPSIPDTMKGKLYESEFEEAVVALLQQVGWEYTHGDSLFRKVTEPLLEEDLTWYLTERYEREGLSSDDVSRVVAHLRYINGNTDYEALRNAVTLYQDGFDYQPMTPGVPAVHIDYIDYEHPERNQFRVVNQFTMVQGNQTRIPDVMLFVNGIPVCIFELKNPTNPNVTIRDAHEQITVRYRRDIPVLLKYCALACISDGSNTRLGNTVSDYEFFYAWKKVDNEDESTMGLHELETLVRGALAPTRLLEILRDFVYFPDPASSDKVKELEVVCRYPQFFAARRLMAHIVKHLRSNGGDGRGGTYFGATGCGKTYTMLFLARLLSRRCKAYLATPTILLIVDREDLENQAQRLFCCSQNFLGDKSVRVMKNRADLSTELKTRRSGGFYVTTVQKFTESLGLLSERADIICLSDEAHRTQTNTGSKLVIRDGSNEGEKAGAFISYGFAKYLRDALPNATYVGFTGTPIDETIHVFGQVVDSYTMIQSQQDGITVPITYDPRLARVFLDSEQAKQIEEYYRQCEIEGARPEDVDKSKAAMSSMNVILGDPDRLLRVAKDIIADYETRCADAPHRLIKAMVTCSDRAIAYKLYRTIERLKPEWCEAVKALDESSLTEAESDKLAAVPFVNVVATTGSNDPKAMFDLLGDDKRRRMLDAEFKSESSNFHIAIVVDMWITGFDAPPLTVLYNDKPLQKHTLIQTISRVNRVYKDKPCGYVVDYIGIRENMKAAMKHYGGGKSAPKEDLEVAHDALATELQILREMLNGVDFSPFFGADPLARLCFLQTAAEYILANSVKEKGKVSFEGRFRGHVKRLREAYNICNPAGILTEDEVAWSQCFMGIMSFLRKITDSRIDAAAMNKVVENMVKEALSCTGVESVLESAEAEEDIFAEKFLKELDEIKLPYTKFQLLMKMLARAIKEYGKTNKVRAEHFEQLLAETVDEYNSRDKLIFTNNVARDTINAVNEVVTEKVNELTEHLFELFRTLQADKLEFRKLGISFEEKAFYDILVELRDKHGFEYPDERCIELAKMIKELVAETSLYADWMNNDNLKNRLSSDLLRTIYNAGYPPEWNDEIFAKVLEQVENFKRYRRYDESELDVPFQSAADGE